VSRRGDEAFLGDWRRVSSMENRVCLVDQVGVMSSDLRTRASRQIEDGVLVVGVRRIRLHASAFEGRIDGEPENTF